MVTYLALLDGGHVPLLAGAHHQDLADVWEPDAVIQTDAGGWSIEHRRSGPGARAASRAGPPAEHVRLHRRAQARAPVAPEPREQRPWPSPSTSPSRPDDRGITSLPLHYCYGLSVLHSHLAAGAGVVLTSASVVDPCFAAALRDGGVTNIAGVPHTYALLDQAGA